LALVTWLGVGAFRRYARHRGLVDRPGARSSHSVPTPTGGGLVMVLSFVGGLVWLWWAECLPAGLATGLGAGAGVLGGMGYLDDRHDISSLWRLLVQFAVVLSFLYWIPGMTGWDRFDPPGWVVRLGVVIGWVWLINLYNFMDGIDGLAASQAVFVAAGAAAILVLKGSSPVVPVLCVLAAVAAGFLPWNWPPAKIFMGDAGSGFLGFSLGALAVTTIHSGELTLWSWIILLGVFVVDATLTLLVRLFEGQRWYAGHRSHAYQQAARRWGGHRPVSLVAIAINLLWLWPMAWYASNRQELGVILSLISLVPLTGIAWGLGAGAVENSRDMKKL